MVVCVRVGGGGGGGGGFFLLRESLARHLCISRLQAVHLLRFCMTDVLRISAHIQYCSAAISNQTNSGPVVLDRTKSKMAQTAQAAGRSLI